MIATINSKIHHLTRKVEFWQMCTGMSWLLRRLFGVAWGGEMDRTCIFWSRPLLANKTPHRHINIVPDRAESVWHVGQIINAPDTDWLTDWLMEWLNDWYMSFLLLIRWFYKVFNLVGLKLASEPANSCMLFHANIMNCFWPPMRCTLFNFVLAKQ